MQTLKLPYVRVIKVTMMSGQRVGAQVLGFAAPLQELGQHFPWNWNRHHTGEVLALSAMAELFAFVQCGSS